MILSVITNNISIIILKYCFYIPAIANPGYDVLITETLQPFILEANMSPAMAHRTTQQSALIAHMTSGLLDRAVYPHFPTTLSITQPPQLPQSDENQSIFQEEKSGSWELLTPPSTSTTSATIQQDEEEVIKDKEDLVETPFIPLNDWDEMPPPPTTGKNSATKSTNTTSINRSSNYKSTALQRKFSMLPPRNSTSSSVYTSGTSSMAVDDDLYYQKFIDAAATAASASSNNTYSTSTNSSTKVSTGSRNVSGMIVSGTAIDTSAIEQCDCLCVGYGKILTLQR